MSMVNWSRDGLLGGKGEESLPSGMIGAGSLLASCLAGWEDDAYSIRYAPFEINRVHTYGSHVQTKPQRQREFQGPYGLSFKYS